MAASPDRSRAATPRRETGALLRLFAVLVEVADRAPEAPDAARTPPPKSVGYGADA